QGGFEALAKTIGQLVKPEPPSGVMAKMKKGLELAKIASFAPKYVKKGACQQVVKTGDEINLFDLPILKCWPHDGDPRKVGYPVDTPVGGGEGRFITLGGIYTIHPDDADKPAGEPRQSRNVGMYRAQLIDKNHTAMHWHMHHDGARHWRAWKKIGKPMPLAIVLGGESVLPYAATAPLPLGISELLFAGFLAGKGIDLVQCKTIDMQVPANAEIVLEGFVSTEAGMVGYDPRTDGEVGPGAVFEGPFGDHTGFYSLPDRYPLFEVTGGDLATRLRTHIPCPKISARCSEILPRFAANPATTRFPRSCCSFRPAISPSLHGFIFRKEKNPANSCVSSWTGISSSTANLSEGYHSFT
ncbi:MAG: UbiD family decarboxylase, partial [Marinosulfonomonas sp.]|nr:UbiD family decarboxylase [Marinosulfonomonas sp.]